ncbi:glycosyltransferase family 4 protein, partial [Paraburkholderia aspalathi]|nr:glycosyltransferase family 4 protein [Paraburkholderia aspalathi]
VDQLGCEEECLYPHWQAPMTSDPRAADFAAREKAEWALADTVICPSDFVYEHVLASGCPAEKAVIVPYGVDGRFSVERKIRRPGPLRVLTIGQVGLRKGSPYVLEAARRMGQSAQFRMVGSIAVLAGAQAELQAGVGLTGPIPRSEMHAQFEWADVFLLPSLCEGSATAVYEALAAGLPVICTPNTGSVVRHGVDGFITAIRDVDAMVAALETLAGDADLYEDMAYQAQQRATEFTLERYGERLLAALFNRPTEMVS